MSAWIVWAIANADVLVPLLLIFTGLVIAADRHPETAERIVDRIAR